MIKYDGTLDILESIVFPAITFNNELQLNDTEHSNIVSSFLAETSVV
jgi:hypothetical protein